MGKYRMLKGEARHRTLYRMLHLDRRRERVYRCLHKMLLRGYRRWDENLLGVEAGQPGARGERETSHFIHSVPFKFWILNLLNK